MILNNYEVKRLDQYNIVLIEHKLAKDKKTGKLKPVEYTHGYFGTLEGAFERLLKLDADLETPKKLLSSIKKVKEEIKKYCKENK